MLALCHLKFHGYLLDEQYYDNNIVGGIHESHTILFSWCHLFIVMTSKHIVEGKITVEQTHRHEKADFAGYTLELVHISKHELP